MLTRLGLRARVTATFGLGALLLSVCIGTATYLTTRHYLVGERENAALHVSLVNAQTVRDGLYAGDAAKTVLASTAGTAGSYSVLYVNGSWYDSALAIDAQGRVWGWGLNWRPTLCLPSAYVLAPQVLPLSDVTLASGAGAHSLFDAGGHVVAGTADRHAGGPG